MQLAELDFIINLDDIRKDFIRASLTQEYQGHEHGDAEIMRQRRNVVVEVRRHRDRRVGRIYANPVLWYAFHDGENLSRAAVKSVGDQLGLSLQTDPPAQLK